LRMQRRAISPQGGVWWAALCAEQLATSEPPDTYERLVEQARLAESPTLTVVERDIPRTFPERPDFQVGDAPGRLRRVLRAYTVRNTYCQGMSFVAAMLLHHMPEREAFWALAAIAERFLPEGDRLLAPRGISPGRARARAGRAARRPVHLPLLVQDRRRQRRRTAGHAARRAAQPAVAAAAPRTRAAALTARPAAAPPHDHAARHRDGARRRGPRGGGGWHHLAAGPDDTPAAAVARGGACEAALVRRGRARARELARSARDLRLPAARVDRRRAQAAGRSQRDEARGAPERPAVLRGAQPPPKTLPSSPQAERPM
jgi:hypothetical protein